ncbi:hypothetical protein J2Y86_002179 [Pseudomonas migulae]|nr:hypothetical protein [Pseudomonas migulae]
MTSQPRGSDENNDSAAVIGMDEGKPSDYSLSVISYSGRINDGRFNLTSLSKNCLKVMTLS